MQTFLVGRLSVKFNALHLLKEVGIIQASLCNTFEWQAKSLLFRQISFKAEHIVKLL